MVAVTVATNASVQSSRAEDEACTALLSTFNSAGSTPAQRKVYVQCVERMEPKSMTPETDAGLKLAVGGLLAVAVIGALVGAWLTDDDVGLGAFTGFFVAPLGVLLIAGLVNLLHWLFT
jgi:hypothetical protein